VALEDRVGRMTYASEEITCTQNIFSILALQRSYGTVSIPISAIPELRSGDANGAGPSGNGPRRSGKRKRPLSDDGTSGESGELLFVRT
jgi:hypothetical protein